MAAVVEENEKKLAVSINCGLLFVGAVVIRALPVGVYARDANWGKIIV